LLTNKIPQELLTVPRLEPQAGLLPSVLPIGRAVPIQFVIRDGREGIFLLGSFVESKLPREARDGERRRAEVLANQESLVLKLLSIDSPEDLSGVDQAGAEPYSNTVPSTLSKILSRAERETLKRFESSLGADFGVEILSSQEELGQLFARVGIVEEEAPRSSEVQKVLERLIKGGGLEQSKVVEVDDGVSEPLQLMRSRIEITKVLAPVVQRLEQLIKSETALSLPFGGAAADDKGDFVPDELPSQIETRVAASASGLGGAEHARRVISSGYGKFSMNSQVGEVLGTRVDSGIEEAVVQLIAGLQERIGVVGESAQVGVVQNAVDKLMRSLMGRGRAPAAQEGREVVRGAVRKFLEELGSNNLGGVGGDGAELAVVKRGLEQVVKGAELVSDVSRYAQALGDSGYLVVPVLIGGAFSRWEIVRRVAEDGKGRGAGRRRGAEYRIFVELPKLGPLEVCVWTGAAGAKSVRVRFTGQNAEGMDRVKKEAEHLTKRLSEVGYESEISSRVGVARRSPPSWYRSLTRTSLRC
jgi:hypothetical protein